jgi:hypothetical protein
MHVHWTVAAHTRCIVLAPLVTADVLKRETYQTFSLAIHTGRVADQSVTEQRSPVTRCHWCGGDEVRLGEMSNRMSCVWICTRERNSRHS